MCRLNLLIIFFLLVEQFNVSGSWKEAPLAPYQRIDVSYIFGGQVYNNNYIYNPGFSVRATDGIMLNELVGIGWGMGYQVFENERFLPLYLEVSGNKKKKDTTPVIIMQFGYAPGWYSGEVTMNNYEFKGGICFRAGIGRKIALNDSYSIIFQGSYHHQFAGMSYESFSGVQYSEVLNYDMLVISLGLIRNKP